MKVDKLIDYKFTAGTHFGENEKTNRNNQKHSELHLSKIATNRHFRRGYFFRTYSELLSLQ